MPWWRDDDRSEEFEHRVLHKLDRLEEKIDAIMRTSADPAKMAEAIRLLDRASDKVETEIGPGSSSTRPKK